MTEAEGMDVVSVWKVTDANLLISVTSDDVVLPTSGTESLHQRTSTNIVTVHKERRTSNEKGWVEGRKGQVQERDNWRLWRKINMDRSEEGAGKQI